MYTGKITHNKPFLTYSKNNRSLKKKILTIRHIHDIAGNIMSSIETENTSNKIPRQYRY